MRRGIVLNITLKFEQMNCFSICFFWEYWNTECIHLINFLCFHVGISWSSSSATPKSNVAFRCGGSCWSTPYIFHSSFSKFLPYEWDFLSAVQISRSTQQKAFSCSICVCICFNYSFTWKAPQKQKHQGRKSCEYCSWSRKGYCGRRLEAGLWLKEFS